MPLSPLAGGAGVAELGYLALIGPVAAETIRVPSLILWRLATWLIPVAVGGLAFLVKSGDPEAEAAVAVESVSEARAQTAPAAARPRLRHPNPEEIDHDVLQVPYRGHRAGRPSGGLRSGLPAQRPAGEQLARRRRHRADRRPQARRGQCHPQPRPWPRCGHRRARHGEGRAVATSAVRPAPAPTWSAFSPLRRWSPTSPS